MRLLFFAIMLLFCSTDYGQITNSKLRIKFSPKLLAQLDHVEYCRNHDVYTDAEIARLLDTTIVPVDRYLRLRVAIRIRTAEVISYLQDLGCDVYVESEKRCILWVPYNKLTNVAMFRDVISFGIAPFRPLYLEPQPPYKTPRVERRIIFL